MAHPMKYKPKSVLYTNIFFLAWNRWVQFVGRSTMQKNNFMVFVFCKYKCWTLNLFLYIFVYSLLYFFLNGVYFSWVSISVYLFHITVFLFSEMDSVVFCQGTGYTFSQTFVVFLICCVLMCCMIMAHAMIAILDRRFG